jgi:hypothetical protein
MRISVLYIGFLTSSSYAGLQRLEESASSLLIIDVPGDAVSVRYRVYEGNELLGRLREATFSDRLYLLYLHALTSHQLVDPLTKRTGTAGALEGLKRAE